MSENPRKIVATNVRKVLFRGDMAEWGEGYGTCPQCGAQFYASGVIGVNDQSPNCHGRIPFVLVKE